MAFANRTYAPMGFINAQVLDTLKKYAKDLYAKAGKILSVKEVKPENQLRGSFVLEGEKTNIEICFTLSPENPPLIQEYHIREMPKEK